MVSEQKTAGGAFLECRLLFCLLPDHGSLCLETGSAQRFL